MDFFITRNHRSIQLQSSSVPTTHIIQVDCLKTMTGIFRYLKFFVWNHNANGSWPGPCFCFFVYGISNYTVFGTIVESKTASMSFISTHSPSIYLLIRHLSAYLPYIHSLIHLPSNIPIHPTSIHPQSFIHSCVISCPIYLLSIFLKLSYPSIYPTTHGPILSEPRLQACLLWQILPTEMLINVNQSFIPWYRLYIHISDRE